MTLTITTSPQHIPAHCPTCKTALVRYDDYFAAKPAWMECPSEFICPQCEDRVWVDEPGFLALLAAADAIGADVGIAQDAAASSATKPQRRATKGKH